MTLKQKQSLATSSVQWYLDKKMEIFVSLRKPEQRSQSQCQAEEIARGTVCEDSCPKNDSKPRNLPNLESFLVLSPSESPMETLAGPGPKVLAGAWPVRLARGVSQASQEHFLFLFLGSPWRSYRGMLSSYYL